MDPKDDVIKVLEDWKSALQRGDLEGLLQLYDNGASLWGTLSEEIRHTPEKIREYFVSFIAHEGIQAEFGELYTRVYGETAVCSGYYHFSWKEKDGKVYIPGRFTYVFRQRDEKWLIIDHHSSIKPELPFDITKYLS
jgi:hypothetical protein